LGEVFLNIYLGVSLLVPWTSRVGVFQARYSLGALHQPIGCLSAPLRAREQNKICNSQWIAHFICHL